MLSTNQPHFKKKLLSSALILICSTGLGFTQTVSNTVELEEEELLNKKPTIDLSKIVVTAGGFAQEVKDAPASISVISKQELEDKPFRDVTDAIADVPGVVITGGGATQDISIRGMAPQYTLMMVDGKRQNSRETRPNSDGSGIEQGWIPPLAAIERIEVVRGPMSSRYGSDAMGGVVNIITKKITDNWIGNLRTDYTYNQESDEGNNINSEFYFSGPLVHEKLGLQIYGKYSHRQEDKKSGGVPERRMENIGGKLTFVPIEGQTFELDYGVGFQKRIGTAGNSRTATTTTTIPHPDFPEDEDKAQKITVPNSNSHNNYKRYNVATRYLGEFDHGITTELFYAYEKNDNYSRDMITKNTEVNGNIIIPIGNHTVTVGGQYIDEKLTDNNNQLNKSISEISRKSHAIFVEDEWWLLDNVSLTAGMRYDHDDNYGSHYSPRIYGVWNIDDAFTLKGGISTGYKKPGIRNAVADWGHGTGGGYTNGVILGNPDLKPEKSTNVELGLSYTNDFIDASITGFHTKFKDKLQNISLCNSPDFSGDYDPEIHDQCKGPNGDMFNFIQTNQNIDSAKLKGIEIGAKVRPLEELSLSGSYTWTKTKQTSGKYHGDPLNRIPEHLFKISADWQFTPKANVWTKVSFRGKETSVGRGGAKGKEYDSYTLLDIGGSYKINRDISVFGGVYNVTNKDVNNQDHGKDLEGRRYFMGINVDF